MDLAESDVMGLGAGSCCRRWVRQWAQELVMEVIPMQVSEGASAWCMTSGPSSGTVCQKTQSVGAATWLPPTPNKPAVKPP
ncbi:hypothetical protein H663_002145 [Limnohabitans planktonicus II-D5]|uniref:Uncharacterized protein n=1 Tax=Limnohabitans planktonicus II-D5 TaxID=1293045 RepID=A0A2T7UHX0_9BURK|nr:hypothetical protein H663_002145 [Limnohabitans planktonicus II-D5]